MGGDGLDPKKWQGLWLLPVRAQLHAAKALTNLAKAQASHAPPRVPERSPDRSQGFMIQIYVETYMTRLVINRNHRNGLCTMILFEWRKH